MPWVPILPAIGIQFNFLLCTGLDGTTWAYFGVFLALGLVIYFSYGLWHSNLEADNVTRGLEEVSLITVANRRDSFDSFENKYVPPEDDSKSSSGDEREYQLKTANPII